MAQEALKKKQFKELYEYLKKNDDKKKVFITTSNRWDGDSQRNN